MDRHRSSSLPTGTRVLLNRDDAPSGAAVAPGFRTGSEVTEIETLWVCAALSDADRKAAAAAPEGRLDKAGYDVGGASVRMLNIPADAFNNAYNSVANSTLWFVHHMLYDTPNKPSFGSRFRAEWEDYRAYNSAFAEALLTGADEGAKVAVQDYHLALVPKMLRVRRPDLRIAHFSHTPWAPRVLRMLPRTSAGNSSKACSAPTTWASACAGPTRSAVLRSVPARPGELGHPHGRAWRPGHPCRVHGLGVGPRAAERAAAGCGALAGTVVGTGRRPQADVRVDRTELSKNTVRLKPSVNFAEAPRMAETGSPLAFAYPSRSGVAEYRAYTESVRATAEAINAEFGTDD